MKIRSEINKKKRFAVKFIYLGFGSFLFISILSIRYGKPMFSFLGLMGLVGLAIGIFGIIYPAYAIKCPKCEQGWGYMALYGGLFSIPKRVKFCPFCGHDVDAVF